MSENMFIIQIPIVSQKIHTIFKEENKIENV